jgi:two-component system NtrC family sensor kinase
VLSETNLPVKILHLASADDFVQASSSVIERTDAAISYLRVRTQEDCLAALTRETFDILLAPNTVAVETLRVPYPELLFIGWPPPAGGEAEAAHTTLWALVSRGDAKALSCSLSSAIRHAELIQAHRALQEEMTQTRDFLLKSQRSIATGRLIGSIAHEINNPLEALSNLIYLCQRSLDKPSTVQEVLGLAEQELQRVGAITKQLLSYHRDSKQPQNVNVAETIESALMLFKAAIRQRKIEVVRQIRDPGWVKANAGELRQVLGNLIANAVDAMPSGGRLYLRVRKRRRNGSRICIIVADTGSGISREVLKRLGEPFFTTKGESGTGLGMWITTQLIIRYDGRLRARSSQSPDHHGTVFSLCFPAAQSPSGAEETVTFLPHEGKQKDGNKKTGSNPSLKSA